MNREDIIRMAREAGIGPVYGHESIERFANIVAAAVLIEAELRDKQAEPVIAVQAEPVAWRYKGESWFDGKRWHEEYEVTKDKFVAKFKDENAQPLYAFPKLSAQGAAMSDSQNMPAIAGEVFWRDPADQPPPRGVKLLMLTSGGATVIGDWVTNSNLVAWSPMPRKRAQSGQDRAQ